MHLQQEEEEQQDEEDEDEDDQPEEGQSEGEQRQSLMRVCYPLVLIEDCFTCLLDLEDLDLIVASTPIQVLGERSYYNILKKRQAIVEVFCSICGINTTSRCVFSRVSHCPSYFAPQPAAAV